VSRLGGGGGVWTLNPSSTQLPPIKCSIIAMKIDPKEYGQGQTPPPFVRIFSTFYKKHSLTKKHFGKLSYKKLNRKFPKTVIIIVPRIRATHRAMCRPAALPVYFSFFLLFSLYYAIHDVLEAFLRCLVFCFRTSSLFVKLSLPHKW
jgi:hypothetical protein